MLPKSKSTKLSFTLVSYFALTCAVNASQYLESPLDEGKEINLSSYHGYPPQSSSYPAQSTSSSISDESQDSQEEDEAGAYSVVPNNTDPELENIFRKYSKNTLDNASQNFGNPSDEVKVNNLSSYHGYPPQSSSYPVQSTSSSISDEAQDSQEEDQAGAYSVIPNNTDSELKDIFRKYSIKIEEDKAQSSQSALSSIQKLDFVFSSEEDNNIAFAYLDHTLSQLEDVSLLTENNFPHTFSRLNNIATSKDHDEGKFGAAIFLGKYLKTHIDINKKVIALFFKNITRMLDELLPTTIYENKSFSEKVDFLKLKSFYSMNADQLFKALQGWKNLEQEATVDWKKKMIAVDSEAIESIKKIYDVLPSDIKEAQLSQNIQDLRKVCDYLGKTDLKKHFRRIDVLRAFLAVQKEHAQAGLYSTSS